MDICLFSLIPPAEAFFISPRLLSDKMTINSSQASMILGLPWSVQESEVPLVLEVNFIPLQLSRPVEINLCLRQMRLGSL